MLDMERPFKIEALSAHNLEALFDNRIGAIRIPAFATAAECQALVNAADRETYIYAPEQSPPIGRMGLN